MTFKLLGLIALLTVANGVYAKKCADFSTQAQAQSWYEKQKQSGGKGWKNLDRDGDGRACDCLPGGNGRNCKRK